MNTELLGYVVVSDLHLGPGKRPETPYFYQREEDFFFDDEFAAFLCGLEEERPQEIVPKPKWRLVINGDFVEFLQILLWPPRGPKKWKLWPGVERPIIDVERADGLATSPLKSAWKLERVAEGHTRLFQALAGFLHAGNDLVITKGNHDAEWHWPDVRKKFVETLVASLGAPGAVVAAPLDPWAQDRFLEKPEPLWTQGGMLQFCEFTYCDGPLYVEHGNQHEPANSFLDFRRPINPLFSDPSRGETYLEFPFGSIFVRYFFNEVERHFSYADNVKPTAEAIREIWESHPWGAVKIFARKISPLLRALSFPPVWIRLRRVVKPVYGTYVLLFLGAVVAMLLRFFQTVQEPGFDYKALAATYLEWKWLFALVAVALPFFADFFSGGDERYLRRAAAQRFAAAKKNGAPPRFLAYGHTHDPDVWQIEQEQAWYYNTGTWTTVFSREERLTRQPRQFVFLKVVPDRGTAVGWKACLSYWDPSCLPHQKPLVLEEDKVEVKRKSREYLRESGLPVPSLNFPEKPSLITRAGEELGVPLKRAWEAVLGIPAWLVWVLFCTGAHLLRPFWRLLVKHLLRLRFSEIRRDFRRDWRLMLNWFRVSWQVLWS